MKELCDAAPSEDGDGESPRCQLERIIQELGSLDASSKMLKSAIESASKRINKLQNEISNHKVMIYQYYCTLRIELFMKYYQNYPLLLKSLRVIRVFIINLSEFSKSVFHSNRIIKNDDRLENG